MWKASLAIRNYEFKLFLQVLLAAVRSVRVWRKFNEGNGLRVLVWLFLWKSLQRSGGERKKKAGKKSGLKLVMLSAESHTLLTVAVDCSDQILQNRTPRQFFPAERRP